MHGLCTHCTSNVCGQTNTSNVALTTAHIATSFRPRAISLVFPGCVVYLAPLVTHNNVAWLPVLTFIPLQHSQGVRQREMSTPAAFHIRFLSTPSAYSSYYAGCGQCERVCEQHYNATEEEKAATNVG